jgi:hypothetical protein
VGSPLVSELLAQSTGALQLSLIRSPDRLNCSRIVVYRAKLKAGRTFRRRTQDGHELRANGAGSRKSLGFLQLVAAAQAANA